MTTKPTSSKPPRSPITCRKCAGSHLTIKCPNAAPMDRAKSLKEMKRNFEIQENLKPYHCVVPMYPGKGPAIVRASTTEEFWIDIHEAHNHSCYRDFVGIQDMNGGVLFPIDSESVPPGKYKFVSRSSNLPLSDLLNILDTAKIRLCEQRPIAGNKLSSVHDKLVLHFNHFSLKHEGNSATLDEIQAITDILSQNHSAHHRVDFDEISEEVSIPEDDVIEAVNHINTSAQLRQMAQNKVSEATVLQLHFMIMENLLADKDEGVAGKYRRVPINISGSKQQRPLPEDVAPRMKQWAEKSLCQRDNEHFVEFLTRIHCEFQDIHPFRDGNGRTGRLIMNTLLLHRGYPILAFAPKVSNIFNHGVELAIDKKPLLFTRLLAESLFNSFQAYEEALGVKLLPSLEDLYKSIV